MMQGDGAAQPDTVQKGEEDEEEPVDLDEGLFKDPIVGVEQLLHDETGP